MSVTTKPVDNGINLPAILEARQMLTDAPEAGKFLWRASSTWKNGTHCYSKCEKFNAFGEDHPHRQEYGVDMDHPELFASEDNGAHADRDRHARTRRLPDRRRRVGRHDARHPAAQRHRHHRRRHGPARRDGRRSRSAQRLQRGARRRSTSTPTRHRTTSPPSWRRARSARRSTTSLVNPTNVVVEVKK